MHRTSALSPIKYDELCFLAGEPIPPGFVYCELPNSLTAPPIRVRTGPNGPQVEEYYRERLARVGEDLPFSDPKTAVYEVQEPAGRPGLWLGGAFVLAMAFWLAFFWWLFR